MEPSQKEVKPIREPLESTLAGGLNPLEILREAMNVAPATRWAMGVVGLASAAAIIIALLRSPVFGLVGMAAVFVAMVALFIFSRVVKFASRATRPLAIVFMWFVGIIAMATIGCVFLSSFFNFPWPLRDRLFSQAVAQRARQAGLPEVAAAANGLSEEALIKLVELNETRNHIGYFEPDTGNYIMAPIPKSVQELDEKGLLQWTIGQSTLPKSEVARLLARLGLNPPWQVTGNAPQVMSAAVNTLPHEREILREFSYRLNDKGLSLYRLVLKAALRQIREV